MTVDSGSFLFRMYLQRERATEENATYVFTAQTETLQMGSDYQSSSDQLRTAMCFMRAFDAGDSHLRNYADWLLHAQSGAT